MTLPLAAPLAGLSIIEASSFVAAPTTGLYCAQLGAEVIRVDQMGGGPDFRRWPLAPNGASLYWENLNRGKASVALNLGDPDGRALLQALVRATGQAITNFPVGGFMAHQTLAEGRPDLITVRVMGTAQGGSALDYTVNAAVGFPDMTGPGPEPVNHVLPAWDLLTGAYAAFALLAALRQRDQTGVGGEVRVPLADAAIASVSNLGMIAEVAMTGAGRERLGNAVYGAFGRDFETRDGQRLMILAITPRQWQALVETLAIGPEIRAIEAERGISFAHDEGVRFAHRDALFPLVESRVRLHDRNALQSRLEMAGGCVGRYQSMAHAAHDPALVTKNPLFSASSGNPSGLAYPAAGAIAGFGDAPRPHPRPAPELGADTDRILAERLGLSADERNRLAKHGIIAAPAPFSHQETA